MNYVNDMLRSEAVGGCLRRERKDAEDEKKLIRHNSIMRRVEISLLSREKGKGENFPSQKIFHRRLGTKSLEPFVGINNVGVACWCLRGEKLCSHFPRANSSFSRGYVAKRLRKSSDGTSRKPVA